MDEAQRKALRKCRVQLVNDLLIDDLFDLIETKGIFTPIMLECIKAKGNRPEKVRTFLDYIQRRGPGAFESFVECLREAGFTFLANSLQEECMRVRGLRFEPYPEMNGTSNEPPETFPTQESTSTEINGSNNEQHMTGYQEIQGPLNEQHKTGYQASQEEAMVEGDEEDGESTGLEQISQRSGLQESQAHTGTQPLMSPTTQGTGQFWSHPSIERTSSSYHGYTGNTDEEYKMESNPRGLLVIINNRNFCEGFSSRDGTDVDCDRLKTLFLNLGFGVDVRHNLTALEIKSTLNHLSKHQQLQFVDCLSVAILTHGSEDYLFGVDGRYIFVNEAFEHFTAEKCPALHHKPKFFIINACRGGRSGQDSEDRGSLTVNNELHESHPAQPDIVTVPPGLGNTSRIPNMMDFLVAYSTIPGHVSWRHLNEGSWFIQGLVRVFSEFAKTKDVMSMLVKVNKEVTQNITAAGVQIPAPQVMLTKTWYLNPITEYTS